MISNITRRKKKNEGDRKVKFFMCAPLSIPTILSPLPFLRL